jgi:3-phenylpropionate/cinnamic acid dioxygenase small subunit
MVTGAEHEANVAALKAHYCQWLDAQDWDRWSALFTEDATMQVGPNPESAVHGRPAIRRLLTTQLRGAKTLHQVREPEIHEEGPGQVRVIWRMTDRVATPLYLLEGAGFYEDRYVHTDDGWKIAGVRLHRNKVDLQPKSFLMRAILWMHHNGWLKRLSASADRTLGEALYVGLAEGERP